MTSATSAKNLPRDVFLYLLAIITLVASAISFGIVVFQYINVYIPDIISDSYFSRSSYLNSLRSALAALIIIFPVFIWVSRFLRKDINNFPEKRDLKIRKWLLYLTLFAAALVIIGDLVALLRNFLEGELSQRFVLKVVAILFIAGSVFFHYLSELRERGKELKQIRVFDWVVVSIVLAGSVAGFFVAGTPQNQRLVRLDERRTSDLQTIQWQIINYWQKKEVLPSVLDDLVDPISGFFMPRDPETNGSYEYRLLGELKFELCAVFNTSSYEAETNTGKELLRKPVPAMAPGEIRYIGTEQSSSWQHDMGRTCFERTIDPDLYPLLKGKSL